MENTLASLIPDPEDLLNLEPEDLAGVILEYLNRFPDRHERIHPGNLCSESSSHVTSYPKHYWKRISRALMEAWNWLERWL